MSDFVSSFWSNYVIVLTVGSILGCLVILWMNRTRTVDKVATMGHVWDETLEEYNNPLPRWWSMLFYITVFFAFIYLAMYPGLGNIGGSLGWSSVGQYENEMKKANEQYGPIFDKFAKMPIAAVAANPEAKQMGDRLFQTYCAQCHGSAAQGAKGFPNLTDPDWLYGGDPETIKASIHGGRQGVMPPMGAALSADEIKDTANFVRSLSGLQADSVRAQRGKEVFAGKGGCVACHGPDAKGMRAVGAPNLTDKVWLYGNSEATIIETITNGRMNNMPPQGPILGEAKTHLLAAYVFGLGGGEKGAGGGEPMAVLEGNLAKLYFETGKADIGAEGQSVIAALVDLAKANANAKFAISGFHDATGDKAVNEELAKNRAFAVRDALKAVGVGEDRIDLRKPSETTGSGDNKEARRVEVSIL